ncbi:MAG: EamA family transporter [Haliea sp.]|uniref:DMT family transporter n=1 Tax=Haliea sp. TaxID=1932666 RepID=UPI000C5CE31B|nr:EamA family transporter [Haliea sp.]MBM69556.1 EamA family transporter [Haliea sp.]|tara:strand:+ start:65699 stop:66574 length:876 start_codon:yes stop_codon:yes gene_type:complete
MNNLLLYAITVVIWGSTWIAIKFQLGTVAPMVSIAHRSMLAALLIFLYLVLRRRLTPLSRRDHLMVFFQGLCLFSGNYLFIYPASEHLASGLVAVVFSTQVVLNMVNGAIFLRLPISGMVALGAGIGLVGMVGVFMPQLESFTFDDAGFRALLLCFAGTCCASFGNIFAARNSRDGLPVLVCNAWGMLYGALALYTAALLLGTPITVDWQFSYLSSLLYLAVFGSVVAFWAYVTLIGNIGPGRAAYSSLLFPVVALLISTVFEGYHWTLLGLLGFALVLAGNWLVMRRGTA